MHHKTPRTNSDPHFFVDNPERAVVQSVTAERRLHIWKDIDEISPKPPFSLGAPLLRQLLEEIGSEKNRPEDGVS